jgi:hypothetical protein
MSDVPPNSAPRPALRARPQRRWVWFFLFLAVVPAALLSVEIWFNLHQQLTPERLAAARARWDQKGSRDYVLDYAIKRDYDPDPVQRAPEKYTVRVKGRKVEAVTGADSGPPPAGAFEFGIMDDLFDRIDQRLRADRETGAPRAFVKADFDPRDGHITHYVHSVSRTRERLEVTVTLRPLTASSP